MRKWKGVLGLIAIIVVICIGAIVGYMVAAVFSKYQSDSDKEQVVLTYATMNLDMEMRSWIAEYNKENRNCKIEVKEYGKAGYDTGLMKMNTDIVSRNAPDIIDLSEINIGAYISKEVLVDLYPYIEQNLNTKKENFVPGILQLYEEGNRLYGIPIGYSIETLMGKEAVIGEASQWTYDKMQKLVEELPVGASLIDNLGPIGLMRIVLQMGMEEYVDWEMGTCSFDSVEFMKVLKLAASMEGIPISGSIEDHLASNRLLLNRTYISSVEEYKDAIDMFHEENIVCVGYPSADGGSSLIYPYLPVGITSMCTNKEVAWEFVSSLLEEEFQENHIHFNFPIRVSSLEKEFQQAITPDEKRWNLKENKVLPTQDDIDKLYDLINASGGNYVFDKKIWNIIEEEAEVYFYGKKTIEETAEMIQNRVQVYLSENY